MKTAIFKLVKFETTQNWREEFLKELGITKVHTWYIFNSNEVTNCCEITPSYELLPVAEEPENVYDMTQENREMFYENATGNLSEDSIYMHCNSVDPIAKDLPSEFTVEYNDDEAIDEYWNLCIDTVSIFQQDYMHLL
jgi:hypothetical protein